MDYLKFGNHQKNRGLNVYQVWGNRLSLRNVPNGVISLLFLTFLFRNLKLEMYTR